MLRASVCRLALAVAMVSAIASIASAQQPTTTSTTETKRFEIIAVDGNNLVVRLPEGTREITVPDDFRLTVNGQQMSVQELKPGMKGTASITTKTTVTPVTVTEVKNGTVRQVTGSTIMVQTDQGFKTFTQSDADKRGVKIIRDGQPVQLSDLRSGDKLSATIVTTKPPRVQTEKQVQATLAREAAPPAEPARPTAGARAPSAPAEPAAGTSGAAPPAPATRKLPKTATQKPLLGGVAVMFLVLGFALAIRRRFLAS
jgi:hypothetical protein